MSGIEIYGTVALDWPPKKKAYERRPVFDSMVHDQEMKFARCLLVIVAEMMNRPLEAILGPGRSSWIYPARMVAMAAIREFTGLAETPIGELIGGRDHSTVHHGLQRAKRATWMPGKMAEIRDRIGLGADMAARNGQNGRLSAHAAPPPQNEALWPI